MKKFLFSCLLFIVTCINAQINLGVGSTTTGIAPISTYYGYSYVQQIFPKTEINAAAAGNITGLRFYLSSSATLTNSASWTVYLGHTTKNTFDSNTDWIPVTSLTQVFIGTVTNNAGVVEITLPTPFAYNNTDNLVIAARETSPNYDSNNFAEAMYVYTTASNRSIYYRSDSTNPNPTAPPTALGRNNYNSATTILGLTPSPIPACPTVTAPAAAATGVDILPNIAWNAVSGATGYRLSVGTTPGGTNVINDQDLGNVTNYTLTTALQYNTQYYYRVSSYSATNPSAACTERSFTTKTIPCPTVSAPAAGAVGISTTPTITWAAVTGATGYRLTVGTTTNGTQVLNNVDLGNVTSYTFPTALQNNTQYFYRVNSYNAGGSSASCTERNFRTICNAVTVLPWTENFNALTPIGTGIVPPCWAQVAGTYSWVSSSAVASTTSPGPRSAPNYMRIQYSNTNPSQLWTPTFTLNAGTTYEFSFYYHTGGTATNLIGFTGNVVVNTAQSMTGATNLGTFITATQGTADYTQYKIFYTPTTTENYTFGLNVSSNGTPWYLGVDDFRLRVAPTCIEPLGVVSTGTTGNTATVSWNAPTAIPANGYEIYYSTTTTPPATPQVTGIPGTSTSYTVPGLTPSTVYYIWVRAICSATDKSDLSDPVSIMTTQIPATLPYIQPFTGPNDFGFLNGTQTNKWFYGSATGNTGNSIYISNNSGTANAYSIGNTSVTQAYRDILIPAGTTIANFSFDWKAQGESIGSSHYDYLRVWLVPSTFMPTPGTQIGAATGRIQVGQFNLQGTAWQNFSNNSLNVSGFAGTVMRLVFEWRNDGSGGTQPPAAVDNIIFRVCSTDTPVVTVTPASITHNSATLTWPQDPGGASYQIRYRPVGSTQWLPTAGPIDVAGVLTPNNTYQLQGLLSYTLYEVEVAAVCNTTNVGVFSHNEFTTRCDPTPPNITISNITPTSALITWNPLAAGSTYELQWREVGTGTWFPALPSTPQPPANSYLLQGLSSYKTYEVQVRNTCVGSTTPNPWSTSQVFTTVRVCEIPPPGLTITQLTPTTAEVVWDAYTGPGATNTYILRYRKVGIPSWTNVNVNTNTHTLVGLLELTKYEMQVANICSGTPGNFTPLYYFTTPTVVYCPMQSGSAATEFISKVTAKPTGKPEMINATAGAPYSDFTTDPVKFIDMIQGSVGNQIIVDKTMSSGANAGVSVWIDFDRSGTFDLNERILADGPNTNATASATFGVPANAYVGSTDKYVVMRVAMSKDGIPVNCTNFANGEVEDYTVRISKLPSANTVNQDEILIYPNPVKSVLNVKNVSKKANYKIYSAAGQLVSSGVILNNKIDVSRLINGVYVIDIDDVQGTAQKKFIKE